MKPTLVFLLLASLSMADDRIKYERCTPENSYLESKIPADKVTAAKTEDYCSTEETAPRQADTLNTLSKLDDQLLIPPECVLASQRLAPSNGFRFGVCIPDATSITSKNVKKPCLSRRYHLFVHSSYLRALRCLGFDQINPLELFPLLNLESHFQLNIGSHSGAWGVGQLTSINVAITNASKRLNPYLEKSDCKPVLELLQKPMSSRNACEWISPPENPTRNFLYAGISYLAFKSIANSMLAKRAAFAKLKTADREKTLFELTAYMYNGGDGGVKKVFDAFMDETGTAPMTYAKFHKEFKAALLEHFGDSIAYYQSPAPDPTNAAAIKKAEAIEKRKKDKKVEISNHVTNIISALTKVEEEAGVKCSPL